MITFPNQAKERGREVGAREEKSLIAGITDAIKLLASSGTLLVGRLRPSHPAAGRLGCNLSISLCPVQCLIQKDLPDLLSVHIFLI